MTTGRWAPRTNHSETSEIGSGGNFSQNMVLTSIYLKSKVLDMKISMFFSAQLVDNKNKLVYEQICAVFCKAEIC